MTARKNSLRPLHTEDDEFERPYINELAADLEERAEANWNSATELHRLYAELLFRSRKRAIMLRARIGERLQESVNYFPWPTTEVDPGQGAPTTVTFTTQQGLLGFLGYRVGVNGATQDKRRALLEYVYQQALPKVVSLEYMADWGNPTSAERLKKMANSIAASVRLRKRNNPERFALAIREWESDLRFLKKTFYEKYKFPWPNTSN